MSLWRQVARGLRALTDRSAADHDVADEVRHYLEETVAAHRARGLSPADARRAARLELGGAATIEEEVRASGWENAVEALAADLRYAGRRLRRAPGFTAVAVLTLALGIGATTAIFSAVYPVLFAPLPYPDAGRLAMILELNGDGSRNGGTFGMYRGLVDRTRSFDAVAVFKPWQPAITGGDRPERLDGQRVSASYFRVLGVAPALGRDFQPSDDQPNGPDVVMLSDAMWRRRFAGDRSIVGRPVTLDGTPFVVIGVMPGGLDNVLAPAAELWAPLQYGMSRGSAWGHHLRTVGRLRPGIGVAQASREIDQLGTSVLREQHPETYDPRASFGVVPLHGEITRGVRPALLAILGAVLLVLVIACVNVTNLLLTRGVQRRGEFALRAALGAGHGRLARQLLTESLLLAAIGGAVGMAVAVLGARALVALSPPGLPRAGAIGVHGVVFAFGLGLTTLIGLAFGLVPALQAARSDPQPGLQQASRGAAGGHRRTRGALVVVEVALALVLLVGSGLLLRSLQRLFAVDAGFDPSRLLTMQVLTVGHRFDDAGARNRFFERVLEAVRHVPGVTAAAYTSQLPLSGDRDEYGVRFEPDPEHGYDAFRYAVSAGYIEAMRIPLRRGRALNDRDRADTPRSVLITESLARRRFAGADPVGRRLEIGPVEGYTIVGVVGDVRQTSLALSQPDAVYIPASQWPFGDNTMSLVIRTGGAAAGLAPAVRRAVWSVDKDQPVTRVATMDGLIAASATERRFALMLFEAFGLAALVLAALGLYGVLSGRVAERTREIGVRSALGATRANILALVVRQGMALTGLGVAIGLVGAAAASRAIAAMLFGVSRLDPVTYLGVIALLGSVSVLASGVPAWRAARVDPARTLRVE
jgi:putative ABC transport system permease protein